MSINAAVEIVDFTPLGGEVFNSGTGEWENITLIVTYPNDQSFAENPITVNDIMVDRMFQVWDITAVNSSVSGELSFNVNLKYKEGTPSSQISPHQATEFGLIITPTPGGLNPYWNADYVNTDVWKKARSFSVSSMQSDVINKWQIIDNTNILAEAGTAYLIDSSTTPVQVTTPLNPSIGNCFGVKDISSTASVNNITITSSEDIENSSSDYIINTNKRGIHFIYSGVTYGWISISETMGPSIYS